MKCLYCNKEFTELKNRKKYCGYGCYWSFMKGKSSGIIYTDEVRRKISNSLKGKKKSAEHRKKLSLAKIGINQSEEHKKNNSMSHKGLNTWMKGRHLSEETKLKLSEAHKEEKCGMWKGDNVGYRALHYWINKYGNKEKKCEHCGKDGLTGRKIHWANKSRKYLRDSSDWIRLCVKCHKKYDKQLK